MSNCLANIATAIGWLAIGGLPAFLCALLYRKVERCSITIGGMAVVGVATVLGPIGGFLALIGLCILFFCCFGEIPVIPAPDNEDER